jgi:hypothetical protein
MTNVAQSIYTNRRNFVGSLGRSSSKEKPLAKGMERRGEHEIVPFVDGFTK